MLLAVIQDNLSNMFGQVRNCAQQALAVLAPWMNEAHMDMFFTTFQDTLNHEDNIIRESALQALATLAPKMNETHMSTELLRSLQDNLIHEDSRVRNSAQEAFCALTPKMNEAQITSLLPWVNEKLNDALKSPSFLEHLLSIACPPNNPYAAPIVEKLASIITGNSNEESTVALNVFRQWSCSWIQYKNDNENIGYPDLVESLNFVKEKDIDISSCGVNAHLFFLIKKQLMAIVDPENTIQPAADEQAEETSINIKGR